MIWDFRFKFCIWDEGFETWNVEYRMRNAEFGMFYMERRIRDMAFGMMNMAITIYKKNMEYGIND